MSQATDDFRGRYGPWAVIAGATEGIGRAYAEQLAERGLNVVLLARRQELLDAAAQQIRERHRVEVRAVSLDLAATDLAARFAAAIAGLDVGLLVCNACYSEVAEFNAIAAEGHERMIAVNCRAPMLLCRQVAPKLVERGRGGIIVMTSMAAFQGSALINTYAATKAFDLVFAEGLWNELTPRGVDVLACVAGATVTPAFEGATPEALRPKVFPMQAEDVAREGLAALGRRPVQIAGRLNRLVNAVLRLRSRHGRTKFFSGATRDIYG